MSAKRMFGTCLGFQSIDPMRCVINYSRVHNIASPSSENIRFYLPRLDIVWIPREQEEAESM